MNDADVFGLATFLVVAARDAVDEPAIYGPFRMLDAVDRFIAEHSDDPFLSCVQPTIAAGKNAVMSDRAAFVALLDELAAAFGAETRRRLLGAEGPPPG